MPAPRSSKDVVILLEYAAHLGLADTELVAHLAEMGTLYPREMLGAYRICREKQAGGN
jgi:hypothetical protein